MKPSNTRVTGDPQAFPVESATRDTEAHARDGEPAPERTILSSVNGAVTKSSRVESFKPTGAGSKHDRRVPAHGNIAPCVQGTRAWKEGIELSEERGLICF